MGTFSIWHWLIVLAVVLVLFGGRGKISGLMGDFGKGLKSFKKNMKDEANSDDDSGDGETVKRVADDSGKSEGSAAKDKAANG